MDVGRFTVNGFPTLFYEKIFGLDMLLA